MQSCPRLYLYCVARSTGINHNYSSGVERQERIETVTLERVVLCARLYVLDKKTLCSHDIQELPDRSQSNEVHMCSDFCLVQSENTPSLYEEWSRTLVTQFASSRWSAVMISTLNYLQDRMEQTSHTAFTHELK